MRPKQRSKARLFLGSTYFKLRRYMEWYLGRVKFAKRITTDEMAYIIFTHRTPLLRRLKDVEMWLQYNKITNLSIAISKINHIVIEPGETFSYWWSIGSPTKRKGYVEGMQLFYGSFKPGIGGGICQLSNLIYWMTLHTPLQVTERHRHSYDVFPDTNRTQPFGSGATCAYNYLDLRIYNPTDQPYQLCLGMDADHLIGEWRTVCEPTHTYEVYEKEHRMLQAYWGGYTRQNVLYRRVMNGAKEIVADEFITENRALMMYQPFIEGKTSE